MSKNTIEGVYTARWDVEPLHPDELRLTKGEVVVSIVGRAYINKDGVCYMSARRKPDSQYDIRRKGWVCMSDLQEREPFASARARGRYSKEMPDELSLDKGESLSVYNISVRNWIFVRCKNNYGYVPKAYVKLDPCFQESALQGDYSFRRNQPQEPRLPASVANVRASPRSLTGSLNKRLNEYFPGESKRPSYTDSEIREISLLLKQMDCDWSRVPRLYIVLRTIQRLDLLNELVELGFTDHWFPINNGSFPRRYNPSLQSEIIQAQGLILTKSIDLERGEGTHHHFAENEQLHFESLGSLGSGGYGRVDKIISSTSRKCYARKRIRRKVLFGNGDAVPEVMKRFVSEITIMKQLHHHHIVQYIGSYTDPSYFSLIMYPIADMDLSKYLETCLDYSGDRRAILRSFFGCLAKALLYLHENNIRHRDLKPQNILVHRKNVLLTDFGLSRYYADFSGATTSGITAKSPRYCAPEVADHAPRNKSSDIWSLGCIFLEMCATLKGFTLEDMKNYYAGRGTGGLFVSNNPAATESFISELKVTRTLSDNKIISCVERMLQLDRNVRPTASDVFASIISHDGSSMEAGTFCGACCSELDFSDFSDKSQDDCERVLAKEATKGYKKERVSKIAYKSTFKSSTPRIWTDHSGSSSVEAECLDIEDSRVLPRWTDGG